MALKMSRTFLVAIVTNSHVAKIYCTCALCACALQRGRVLPETWGKWGQPRGRGGGRARPPDKERDKRSSPSKEGGNMEQEEEGKKSRV
jgi:hypothetical protein